MRVTYGSHHSRRPLMDPSTRPFTSPPGIAQPTSSNASHPETEGPNKRSRVA